MVVRQSVCLRELSQGNRAQEAALRPLPANEKVTADRLIGGWSEQTAAAAAGRHVLAIQDTSEIDFKTKPGRRRGLGEIGKVSGRGLLVHAMVAVDADSGSLVGLVGGSVYTRKGRVKTPHAKSKLKDKELRRWVDTGNQAKAVLGQAATIAIVGDREGDIYTAWASLPGENVHVLGRVMHDRAVAGGGTLASVLAKLEFVSTRAIELIATPKREARQAVLSLRFTTVEVLRPDSPDARGLPKTVSLRLVEAIERNPPAGVEPVHWRLLTTHSVADVAAAWQIVDWYRLRWTIEQLFRLMKTQGLQLKDSQLCQRRRPDQARRHRHQAAAVTLQLVQARDGKSGEPAEIAFSKPEIAVLDGLNGQIEGKTAPQKNPHKPRSLAWAAWIIGRLGGWTVIPRPSRRGRSRCAEGWNIFMPSPKVGSCDMCASRCGGGRGRGVGPCFSGCPRRKAETERSARPPTPTRPRKGGGAAP